MKVFLSLVLSLTLPSLALAQDTIDLGVLKDSDIKVVQKVLYPKQGRTELGIHLGWMPFDAYSTTPTAAVSFGGFLSETLGWEVGLGAGYGLKTSSFRELEGPMYGVAPDAYRYLAGLSADVQWSPIYAKMNLAGQRVIHYDVYGLLGAGFAMEDSMVLPDLELAFAPGLVFGVGSRFFLSKDTAIRVQVRDDLLIENRAPTTATTHLRHALGVSVGFSMLSKVKK